MLKLRLQNRVSIKKISKFIINPNNSRRGMEGNGQRRFLHRCEEIDPILEELLLWLEAAGYSTKERFAIRLSLEEALVNAIKHGHKSDADKEVQLSYHLRPEEFLAEIEDQGPGFQVEDVPDPLAPEHQERPCGRGLLLMKNFMSWVRFNDAGNRVTLCLRRHNAFIHQPEA